MTVPSYTEDLTDLDTAESNTGWVEMTGSATLGPVPASETFSAQGAPAGADGDYPFIQGSFSVTQDCSKSAAVGSLAHNNGTGTGGHGTDGAYLVWQNYMVASNISSYADDGFMLVVGSGTADFDIWTVGGVDKSPYPYGGWVNHAVNTTVTPDYTAGTPTATEQYIGAAVYVVTGSSKGEVHNVDVIRYGRCSAIFEFGEAADYADIAGFAAQNDNNSNRWGLIQETAGGYLWKGRMQLGTSTNAVDFRDSDVNIFIQWTPKVTANFNLIECINASSNIEMTGFNITCLDTTTASQGRFLMTDDCDVAIASSTFVDMDTFVFSKGGAKTVTIDDSTFTRCNQITTGGSSFDGCLFDNPTGATAVVASSPANAELVTNSTFISDGTGNGLEIGGTAADVDLTGLTFTGYDVANPGTAANKAIYVNISTGTMTINILGGSGGSEDYHVRSAGATVTVSVSVPLSFEAVDKTDTAISAVQVSVYLVSDDSQVFLGDTAGTGFATGSYGGATPVDIYYRYRKSSTGATKYVNLSGFGTIESGTGLSVKRSMTEDTIADPSI